MREHNLYVQSDSGVWTCFETAPARIEKITEGGKSVMVWEGEASDLGADLERLQAQVERLRLERDMLALNPSYKDPVVFVVTDGATGDVVGVVWEKQRTGSRPTIQFPSYYDEAADAAEGASG